MERLYVEVINDTDFACINTNDFSLVTIENTSNKEIKVINCVFGMPVTEIKNDISYYLFDNKLNITISPNKKRIFNKVSKPSTTFWVVSSEF